MKDNNQLCSANEFCHCRDLLRPALDQRYDPLGACQLILTEFGRKVPSPFARVIFRLPSVVRLYHLAG